MRIRRLDLLAFGPFVDFSIALGPAGGAVDLIYGSNEAGKSTTLRAISGLLFGIPERTDDAHRHAPAELRIGGQLEARGGEIVDVIRRKGRKATLLDREGRPLDDARLAPFLGGTTLELFETMFGLDHDTLASSAQSLLEGKGSVGESLFAAGVGARGVHALRERLLEEADRLFTSRGRDQKAVVRAIADVREARKTVDEASTSAKAYLEQRRVLAEATGRRDALRERAARLSAEQLRLQRWLGVLPQLAIRARVLAELAPLEHAVRLAPDAPERRRAAVHALEQARQKRERVAEEIERAALRLGEIVVPESLLGIDETVVRELNDACGRHVAAQRDLPKRTGELRALEETTRKSIEAVDPRLRGEDVERLRLGAAQAARIRRLAVDHAGLEADLRRLGRDLGAAQAKRDHLALRLAAVVSGRDGMEAARAVLERPEALAVPAPAVIDRHLEALQALAGEREAARHEGERLELRRRDVMRELDALRRLGDVPTEGELGKARGARAELWAEVRDALGGGSLPKVEHYERAVSHADEIADRLRREADRVAKLAALSAEEAALQRDLESLRARAGGHDARARELDADWTALWAGARVAPASPDEMRPWSERFLQLLDLDGERARLERESSDRERALEKWQAGWAEALAPLGLGAQATPEEATAALETTGEVLRRVDDADRMRRRIEGMERDSRHFTEEVATFCALHLPSASDLPPAEAAQRLVRAHEQARRDDQERSRLRHELEKLRRTLAELDTREREAQAEVQSLLRAARVDDLASLEEAERRSGAALVLTSERDAVERKLLHLGEGATIDALIEQTRGLDTDRAQARLRDLREEMDAVSQEVEEVAAAIATLEAGVSRLEQAAGADSAAELAERVSRLKRHVHRYVRVRLASALLDREIERYRQANQGPIVERANELFPRLTAGRYSGLRVGFGASDDAVLLAVRADGASVPVEGLSDGTRYGLYLALRLASLERHARANEPMPLVLDDVLLTFDDERALAALRVLGDVAATTQVLFFTHHAHLVELARTALGPARLAEHVLRSTG